MESPLDKIYYLYLRCIVSSRRKFLQQLVTAFDAPTIAPVKTALNAVELAIFMNILTSAKQRQKLPFIWH